MSKLSRIRTVDQACQRCGHRKSQHGPNLECPCIVYTDEGSFVQWNPCKFLGLEITKRRKK